MRRLRLLLWKLYQATPLTVRIEESVERDVARRCKMPWEDYLRLKTAYPCLWERYALKREKALAVGHFPRQPAQLRRWRKVGAKHRAVITRERPRFTEWALKKLMRQRKYKYKGLRERVLNRLMLRLIGL